MDYKINKTGVLYSNMKRGRTKLTVIYVLLLALFIIHSINTLPYLEKRAFGSVPLDIGTFASLSPTTQVTSTYAPSVEESKIYGHARKKQSYWQGSNYFFSVKLDSLESCNLAYTASGAIVENSTDTQSDPVAVKVDFITIDGTKTAVLSMGSAELKEGMVAEGIFVEISPLILKDLAAFVPEGEVISKYMLDVRGIDMDSEYSDTVIWFVFVAVLLFLSVKLFIYYTKPIKHPTFAQLEKYGTAYLICQDIESQIEEENAAFEGDRLVSSDWIITKTTFACKVEKNFAAGGKFKYTPF